MKSVVSVASGAVDDHRDAAPGAATGAPQSVKSVVSVASVALSAKRVGCVLVR